MIEGQRVSFTIKPTVGPACTETGTIVSVGPCLLVILDDGIGQIFHESEVTLFTGVILGPLVTDPATSEVARQVFEYAAGDCIDRYVTKA